MLSSVTKEKGIETPGQGRAFAYCPPDLDCQVESDPKSSLIGSMHGRNTV